MGNGSSLKGVVAAGNVVTFQTLEALHKDSGTVPHCQKKNVLLVWCMVNPKALPF